jgi:hypothetical protein
MHLTLMGHIVIGLGCNGHADYPQGAKFLTGDNNDSGEIKQNLNTIHFQKIDLADEIFVINVGGYIGESTRKEIIYAIKQGKTVNYMFSPATSMEEKS